MSSPSSLTTGLSFSLSTTSSNTIKFGPRLGNIALHRHRRPASAAPREIDFDTPNLLTCTSRGIVPHLSMDHCRSTRAIHWVHVPFETFLEQSPPVPTLQQQMKKEDANPLHTFLGYSPIQHILSMSVRDPADGREMPTNGNTFMSAYSLRGVRKITPAEWRKYVLACQPDVIVALTDTPLTRPPFSQKRLTKSIERSTAWLMDLLTPSSVVAAPDLISTQPPPSIPAPLPATFVHMAGTTSISARRAFANNLIEILSGKEADAIAPLRCLDDGVTGYTFDLVPLRIALEAVHSPQTHTSPDLPQKNPPNMVIDTPIINEEDDNSNDALDTQLLAPSHTDELISLFKASLTPLPAHKPRLLHSANSPHEMLRLILHVGVDLFDAHWAQRAADVGVALDFKFPVDGGMHTRIKEEETRQKRDLGKNLYHADYALDFVPLADSFVGAAEIGKETGKGEKDVCPCAACSPVISATQISHGCDTKDTTQAPGSDRGEAVIKYKLPFTRAYIHHLLHTHEMSAHTLLAMHNLSVLHAFFGGVRRVIREQGEEGFRRAVEEFVRVYDEEMKIFDQARGSWKQVEMQRGKGRLRREREKQKEVTLGTAVDVPTPVGEI